MGRDEPRRDAERIADELHELNDHVKAYLETMAQSLLVDCTPDEAGKKGREVAAIKLLRHVQKYREG